MTAMSAPRDALAESLLRGLDPMPRCLGSIVVAGLAAPRGT